MVAYGPNIVLDDLCMPAASPMQADADRWTRLHIVKEGCALKGTCCADGKQANLITRHGASLKEMAA